LASIQAAAAAAAAASFSYAPMGYAADPFGHGARPSQFFPHALPHLSHLAAASYGHGHGHGHGHGEYAGPGGVRKSKSASLLDAMGGDLAPLRREADSPVEGVFIEEEEDVPLSARKVRRRGSFQHSPNGSADGGERRLDVSVHRGSVGGAYGYPGDAGKKAGGYGLHQHHAGAGGSSTTASSSSGNDSDSSVGSGAAASSHGPGAGLGLGLGGLSDLQLGPLPTHEQLYHAHALLFAQQQHHAQHQQAQAHAQAQAQAHAAAGFPSGPGMHHALGLGLGLGALPNLAARSYHAPLGGAGPSGSSSSSGLGKRAMSPFRAVKTEAGEGAASADGGHGHDADHDPTHLKRRQSFDLTQFLPRFYERDAVTDAAMAAAGAVEAAEAAAAGPPSSSKTALDALNALAGRLADEEGGTPGAATHAVVGFCLRRDPWRYALDTPTHMPRLAGPLEHEALAALDAQVRLILGPGPATLYRDIAAYLLDSPVLRAELEAYADALAPFATATSAAPHGPRKQPSSSSLAEMRDADDDGCEAEMESSSLEDEVAYGAGDDDSESSSLSGSLSAGGTRSRRSRRHRSRRDGPVVRYTSRVSPRRGGPSKGNILEDMRTFTSFAALKMQGVAQAAAADHDRHRREGAGAGAGEEADAGAQARVAALAECAASWWDYANLYK